PETREEKVERRPRRGEQLAGEGVWCFFYSLLSLLSSLFAFGKSGRQDLNLRPSGPKPDALARLSYAPEVLRFSLGTGAMGVNGGHEDGGVMVVRHGCADPCHLAWQVKKIL